MIGLTDGEIKSLLGIPQTGHVTEQERSIAKAQLGKLAEWGNGECEHTPSTWGGKPNTQRHECGKCWQYLLNEVKDV